MKRLLLPFISLAITCNVCYANGVSSEDTNSSTDKEKIELTDNDKATLESAGKLIRSAFNSPYLQLSGYGQMLLDYKTTREPLQDIKAKCIYLAADGKINDAFRYSFMVELTNPRLIEYWAEWTADKAFNLKLGQYKVPVTIEANISASAIETINYSRAVASLFGFHLKEDVLFSYKEKSNIARDIGLQASGVFLPEDDYHRISYAMGLFQGSGMNNNNLSGNNKTFAGTLSFYPIKELRLSGGTLFGEAFYRDTSIVTGNIPSHVRNRWLVGGEYKSKRVTLRSEYIRANDGGIDKVGAYGIALYQIIPNKLNVLGKVDYFNTNREINNEALDYTAGIGYTFFKQCTLLANYIYTKDYDDTRYSYVGAQLQIAF